MEQWRDIPGYEGIYQISNCGNVRRNGKNLKPQVDHGGYLTISLFTHSKGKNFKIHRLVALAFIPNPQNKKTVNHIDGDKQNNRVDNLEWATHSENIRHALDTGLRTTTDAQRNAARETGKKTCEANRPRKAVLCIKDGNVHHFESAHAGARFVSGSASAIVRCCKKKQKTYKGCEWRYANVC